VIFRPSWAKHGDAASKRKEKKKNRQGHVSSVEYLRGPEFKFIKKKTLKFLFHIAHLPHSSFTPDRNLGFVFYLFFFFGTGV
jgi:hypothetical protein